MNEHLTENVFILGTGVKLGLADDATARDVRPPMEALRDEEEGNGH